MKRITHALSGRRAFLSSGTMAASSMFIPQWEGAFAQEEENGLAPLNRFPRMMQEHFVRRLREAEAKRIERFEGLKTKTDAEAYVEDIRGNIRLSFGSIPDKTPLNARTTRVIERDTYRIENVIFESRPGFLVTANLYVPNEREDLKYPLPGVVGTCGHTPAMAKLRRPTNHSPKASRDRAMWF